MTTTGAPRIRIEEVSLTFPDGTHALDDVSVTVSAGEMVALVGPSGCGKSTLLRLVAGFEKAGRGTVSTSDHALGYVFQDATLLPWRSVLHNVELPGQLTGIPKASRRASARAAIDRVGLNGFEWHRPAQLSGGMRMRVSIARALTLQPKLFLFDEPFGALDEITRERLNEDLNALFAAEPFAGLFVTHSVTEAVFVATRVIVMSARPGRIVADVPVPFDYPREPGLRLVDSSFDGTPSRFVAAKGKDIQQAYASNEPYRWEHDVTAWKKPVKYLLVHDAGWPIYPQGWAVRSGELGKDSACLKKLVPMIQKAEVDYLKDPAATNATLVKIAASIPGGPPITAAGNADAVTVMKQLKIVANGPNGTLGTVDPARVDESIALLKPIFKAKSVAVPDGLKASDLVTNEFIDPSISLG